MRVLLIDDIRNLEADIVARNYNEGINELAFNGPWDVLLLDHDLASYDEDGVEKTGYDIMCYLEEHPSLIPEKIVCVSDNPVGRMRIETVVNKIMKTKEEKILTQIVTENNCMHIKCEHCPMENYCEGMDDVIGTDSEGAKSIPKLIAEAQKTLFQMTFDKQVEEILND